MPMVLEKQVAQRATIAHLRANKYMYSHWKKYAVFIVYSFWASISSDNLNMAEFRTLPKLSRFAKWPYRYSSSKVWTDGGLDEDRHWINLTLSAHIVSL